MASLKNILQDKNGKVGIGTYSPSGKLHIYTSSSGATPYESDGLVIEKSSRPSINLLSTATSDAYIFFGQPANGNRGYLGYVFSSDQMQYRSTGTHSFMGGNVGIGTTSPAYKLDVNGAFRGGGFIADDSSFTLTFNSVNVLYGNLSSGAIPAASTFGTGDSGIVSDFPGSEVMRIASLGRVGINTTSPQANLHLNGSLRVDAPTNFANIVAGLRADPGNGILGNDPGGLGQDQDILGTPDTWLAVNINGVDYAIPAYAP